MSHDGLRRPVTVSLMKVDVASRVTRSMCKRSDRFQDTVLFFCFLFFSQQLRGFPSSYSNYYFFVYLITCVPAWDKSVI